MGAVGASNLCQGPYRWRESHGKDFIFRGVARFLMTLSARRALPYAVLGTVKTRPEVIHDDRTAGVGLSPADR